jgi:lipoprotein-releasing system permease protein
VYRWVVAWRWLRSLPILWVSVLGVTVGVASILVVDSIFNGVLRELRSVYRGSASDVVVFTQAPMQGGSATPPPIDEMVHAILGVKGVAGAAPRLRRQCLLPRPYRLPEVVAIGAISRRSMIELFGVTPEDEAAVSDLPTYLAHAPDARRVRDLARPFDVSDLPPDTRDAIPILLGDKCADALRLERGSILELLTLPDVDEATAKRSGLMTKGGRFVVAGTFVTTSFLEDLTRAYVDRRALKRFVSTLADATEIAVKAEPGVPLDRLRDAITERLEPYQLGRAFRTPVVTWDQLEEHILLSIENQRHVLGIVLFFIVIVAGFNLLVSLHLLVTEKIRDVGTLASMGAPAFGIASVFTALGLLVTSIGAAVGLAGGALLAANVNAVHEAFARWTGHRLWDEKVYLFQKIPVDFEPKVVGLALIGTFAVTHFFAFLASLRAARLEPVDALRQE